MQSSTPRAIVFDAFGTLIRYGKIRHNPYRRLLDIHQRGPAARLPFLTRNVSADVFAAERCLTHVMPEFRRELDEELDGLQLFGDVEAVIGTARRAGLRIAVCSNLAFEYGPAVRKLLPDLDAHILSCEVGSAKPDPRIYEITCFAVKCAPRETVFVGDSARCDYHGPKAFGMQARRLDRQGGQSLYDSLKGIV